MNSDTRPFGKKSRKLAPLFLVQGRESWQRLANTTVERRRNPPYPSTAVRTLFQLIELVFLHAIGRVRDYSVYGVLRDPAHPLKAIGVHHQRLAHLGVSVVEGKL